MEISMIEPSFDESKYRDDDKSRKGRFEYDFRGAMPEYRTRVYHERNQESYGAKYYRG